MWDLVETHSGIPTTLNLDGSISIQVTRVQASQQCGDIYTKPQSNILAKRACPHVMVKAWRSVLQ